MISQGGHLSQAFPHEPGIPAPSLFFACESSPDLSPHPPLCPRGPWQSTDHVGDKHRNSPVVSRHRAKTAGRDVKNAILPLNWTEMLARTTKDLVCLVSSTLGPSRACEQGHWWGTDAGKAQVPSFQSRGMVSLFPPTGRLQDELLPKPTVKFSHHSLQEKKKSSSLQRILFSVSLADFGLCLIHTQAVGVSR